MKEKNKPKVERSSSEFFGTATVGVKGQFVIPKEARDEFNINPGDKVVIFGGEGGVLAIIKADKLNEVLSSLAGLVDVAKLD